MDNTQLLTALKTDLGITAAAYDERLAQLLEAAQAAIIAEGAESFDPSASIGDAQLLIMYAGYLWRQRDNAQAAMPRMVRWALNNRVFGETAGAGT